MNSDEDFDSLEGKTREKQEYLAYSAISGAERRVRVGLGSAIYGPIWTGIGLND